ncbi:MAG: hypothetical protein JWN70_2107 [Planctomycetaceae bacterium]|nr:hypothetical protein [Planctomycetaceae bacterium]
MVTSLTWPNWSGPMSDNEGPPGTATTPLEEA